jgi:hypothetical protein
MTALGIYSTAGNDPNQPVTESTYMKLSIGILALLAPTFAIADCEWSDEFPILNERKLSFQECVAEKRIRIDGIEVQANIDFKIVHANYPEGNTIWSVHSPDNKTAVVYIENSDFQRNAWVIDPKSKDVLLFIDHAEGKHFIVEFDADDRFRIIHAGMGYRVDYLYERVNGSWANTDHKKVDVD